VAELHWLIIADDLSGAADSAIPFARRGMPTRILTVQAKPGDMSAAVLAYDADSRHLSSAEAAERHRRAVQAFAAPAASVFKKIDSTLRGHPAAEIAAVLRALAAVGRETFGVLAPAFPAMGRTTRDGQVFVHGQPLAQDRAGDLAQLLTLAGIHAVTVSLARVRAGERELRADLAAIARGGGAGPVAVCDAQTDADLDRIVSAARAAEKSPVFIGTGGLAHALARTLPTIQRPAPNFPTSVSGALIVVGSMAQVSRQAAGELARLGGVVAQQVTAVELVEAHRADQPAAVNSVATRAIRAGADVLVELVVDGAPDLSQRAELMRALGFTLAGALHEMGGLIATGGETAAALLSRRAVQQIELVDELETGVALGLAVAEQGTTFPLVTKAGAFGDSGSLVRALEKLRFIRTNGTLA
jgi:D-threonate/D-erythronate kinase